MDLCIWAAIVVLLLAVTGVDEISSRNIRSIRAQLTRIEAELALVREMRHDETPTLAEGWQENREAHNAQPE